MYPRMPPRKSLNRSFVFRAVVCLLPISVLGGCADYLERRDTVTLGAGDAQNWNKVVHTADPWPRYVMDTDIPGDGQRTAVVIQRYSTGPGAGTGGAESSQAAGGVGGAGL
jgi:hypothetical protein